ncbi:CoA transferase [Chloroflexota bacterium]
MLVLEGIKVLDFSLAIQGPLSASMLGDMGAEIIKVERREG